MTARERRLLKKQQQQKKGEEEAVGTRLFFVSSFLCSVLF